MPVPLSRIRISTLSPRFFVARDLDPSVGIADVYPQEITRVLLNIISNGFYALQRAPAE
jgi:hypothetical protein